MGQPVSIVLMKSDVEALAAGISLTAGVFFVRFDFHDTIVFYQDFKSAIL